MSLILSNHLQIEPGSELHSLCTLQLGLLYQLLSKTGNQFKKLRCTAYIRSIEPVEPGTVRLRKVASFPSRRSGQDDISILCQQQCTPQYAILLVNSDLPIESDEKK